jgi:hypothetical protein
MSGYTVRLTPICDLDEASNVHFVCGIRRKEFGNDGDNLEKHALESQVNPLIISVDYLDGLRIIRTYLCSHTSTFPETGHTTDPASNQETGNVL